MAIPSRSSIRVRLSARPICGNSIRECLIKILAAEDQEIAVLAAVRVGPDLSAERATEWIRRVDQRETVVSYA
jgi:hypothetical protein